jgi:hypothetical protein
VKWWISLFCQSAINDYFDLPDTRNSEGDSRGWQIVATVLIGFSVKGKASSFHAFESANRSRFFFLPNPLPRN